VDVLVQQPGPPQLAEDRRDAARAVDVLHVEVGVGRHLGHARHPPGDGVDGGQVEVDLALLRGGRMCSTVLVEPPIATSSAIAFSNALRVAIERGSADASSSRYHRVASSITVVPARSNSARRAACVARVEPLPGSARPSASVRQFIELAVNIPEHEPHVGQAERSTIVRPSSSTSGTPTPRSP
jgi:hypothetical protein